MDRRSKAGSAASARGRTDAGLAVPHLWCMGFLAFRKIGACCGGSADSPSLIALKRATIDVIAASIVPDATAILPRLPKQVIEPFVGRDRARPYVSIGVEY